jgi:cell wall-associated NlpC family hydrolase
VSNLRLARPVSGIAATPNGQGYVLSARDGGMFAFGGAGFFGNAVGSPSCSAPTPTGTGAAVVQYATAIKNGQAELSWSGGAVPYSWGGGHGSTPGPTKGTCAGYTGSIKPCPASSTTGLDCSGFARWVYRLAYGSDVLGGGNTDAQLARMHKVSTPAPGDLVFYGSWSASAQRYTTHHVGVYIGNGQMIDALKTGTNVEIDPTSKLGDLVLAVLTSANLVPRRRLVGAQGPSPIGRCSGSTAVALQKNSRGRPALLVGVRRRVIASSPHSRTGRHPAPRG